MWQRWQSLYSDWQSCVIVQLFLYRSQKLLCLGGNSNKTDTWKVTISIRGHSLIIIILEHDFRHSIIQTRYINHEVKDILFSNWNYNCVLLEFFFRNSITLIVHAHKNYPDITNVIFFILGVYIIYKILVRTLRSWFNFMIFTIKLIFVLFFVFLYLSYIYVVGKHSFIKMSHFEKIFWSLEGI